MTDQDGSDIDRDLDIIRGGGDDAVDDVENDNDGDSGSGDQDGDEGDQSLEDGAGEDEEDTPAEEEEEEASEDEDEDVEEGGKKKKKDDEDLEGLEDEDFEAEGEPTGGRPPARAILKKYPKLFKDFPGLKDAYYREKTFSELFVTPEIAKESKERSDTLAMFEESLQEGNVVPLMKSLANSGGLEETATNFLPTLYKQDPELYEKVTMPIVKNLLRYAKAEAAKHGNKNLANSVNHLGKLVFGTENGDIPEEAPRRERGEDPERKKFEEERRTFYEEKAQELESNVVRTSLNVLKKDFMKNLDPKGVLPDFVKDAMVERAIREIGATLKKDSLHTKTMDSLWERAKKAGFSGEWGTKLITAYLGGARRILPAVRQRLLKDALKGKTTQGKAGETVRRPVPGKKDDSKKPSSHVPVKRGAVDPRKVNWDRTTDLDILKGRAVLKK